MLISTAHCRDAQQRCSNLICGQCECDSRRHVGMKWHDGKELGTNTSQPRRYGGPAPITPAASPHDRRKTGKRVPCRRRPSARRSLRGPWVTVRPSLRWPGIERIRAARYLIQLEMYNQLVTQQIRVSWTRCHFGGARPWLHCPFCQRRVARLFKVMAGYFCRTCIGNPIYESQRRSKKARAHLKAFRLRQRLGGSRPVLDPIPERPYRMKRATYRRLCSRIERLERPLIGSRVIRRAPKWIRPLVY
jgi:hypothetical protein